MEETLRGWVRQAERDRGLRVGPSGEDRKRLKAMECEVRELRQANEIPRKASAYFAMAEVDRRSVQAMIGFIDDHRAVYWVEPICRVLPIAPITYYARAAKRADPKPSARERNDATLQAGIRRVWEANLQVYGVRKVWRQLQREAIAAPRCRMTRLIRRRSTTCF